MPRKKKLITDEEQDFQEKNKIVVRRGKKTNSSQSDIPDAYMKAKCIIMGDNIRDERKTRGFTSEELAEFIELSASYIGLIERGERCPSLKSFLRICELFGETPDSMLTYRPNVAHRGKASVREDKPEKPKKVSADSKRTALKNLTNSLNENQLDYMLTIIKGLKHLEKNNAAEVKKPSDEMVDTPNDIVQA